MKKRFFGILLFAYSAAALSQSTVYYCQVNGKQQITDQPCDKVGGVETKRLEGRKPSRLSGIDPTDKILCDYFKREKQRILDDQYYRGKPASPKVLNGLDGRMRERGCGGD